MREVVTDPLVQAFSDRVRSSLGHNVKAIYWFGSRAKGQGTETSDYDFLIATRSAIGREERHVVSDISVDLGARFRRVLDVHYADEDRLSERETRWSPFRREVLRQGLMV